jgi:hypothetical protein
MPSPQEYWISYQETKSLAQTAISFSVTKAAVRKSLTKAGYELNPIGRRATGIDPKVLTRERVRRHRKRASV